MTDDNRRPKRGKGGFQDPPVEHQFKKGQSGNPRGRPIKMERSFTLRQVDRDILAVTESPTRIRTADGVKTVPVIDAILRKTVQRALEGHGPSLRFILKLHERAVRSHGGRYESYFEFVEMVESEAIIKPVPSFNQRSHASFINDLRRKTRKT